ncbi:magnesium-transporting ATPase (P-type) [Alkalibacillus flavidus]|uniref:Magnesium-transporting ATPase (P-type) n=1 Tax=Alkalibacillus flavidus TaxID=546021 RepID=A0ABV2KVF6_9BACI
MKKDKRIEAIVWSIALPGFAQLLNHYYVKGILFILLEIGINVQARFNYIIIPSFHGDIEQAIETTNYQWIMFYPCLYMFAMWDAYKSAGGGDKPYAYVPFALAAFVGTVGVIVSPIFHIAGVYFGPIWLGIIFHIVGFIGGVLIMKWLRRQLPLTEETVEL